MYNAYTRNALLAKEAEDKIREARKFAFDTLDDTLIEYFDNTGISIQDVYTLIDLVKKMTDTWYEFALVFQQELEDVEDNFSRFREIYEKGGK